MSSTVLVIAILLIVIVVAATAFFAVQVNRRRQLKERFGPEYERVVAETGDTRKAERALDERVQARKKLDIREVAPEARSRYAESWRALQASFVDDPRGAVREADVLVTSVLRDRGYPTGGYEQQADVVSVDHASVVDHYRRAHSISEADAAGRATTDDLRQAMVHYRALFNDLLGQPASGGSPRMEAK
jgi:hypothetical protein